MSRPGAKGTTARVHYLLRLADLGLVECMVTDVTVGETYRHFGFGKGELVIGDRGYANPPGVRHVDRAGAKVMVRYNFGSLPLYDRHGNSPDVEAKLHRVGKPGSVREWQAFVQPAEFVVVFTTVPRARLCAKAVLALYALRWQVELRIKRDESIGELDHLPSFRPDTIHAWLCAKLLAQQLASQLTTPQVAFPPSGIGRAAIHETSPPGARKVGASGDEAHLARHGADVGDLLCRPSANRPT